MKKYERPVVVVNEELAEGVYAASGTGCWEIEYARGTENYVDGENSREFTFRAWHDSDGVGHIPNAIWYVEFDKTLSGVGVPSDSRYTCDFVGNTVRIFASWENMNDNEGWGFSLRVMSEDYKSINILKSYIVCPNER